MRERVCRYGLKPPYQICIATSTTRDDDDAAGRTIEDIINAHTPETDRAKFEAKSYDEEDEKTTLALWCSEWHKTMPILWQRGNPNY